LVIVALFSASFMAFLDQTIVATAIYSIVADLGALNDVSWIFVAYLLTSTAFMPLYG
jgi:MFS family permease